MFPRTACEKICNKVSNPLAIPIVLCYNISIVCYME